MKITKPTHASNNQASPKNKKVIYTAISGGYDKLPQPLSEDSSFDYICFVDEVTKPRDGVWMLRKNPYHNDDPVRRARYIKLQPHVVLPEYDYSVWLDANVTIATDFIYRRVDELIRQGTPIAHIKHWGRDCIYEETIECTKLLFDNPRIMAMQFLYMKLHRYPRHNGLIESNLCYRHHSAQSVITASNLWWTLLRRFSRRDQLSLNYVYWKLGLKYEYFMEKADITTRNSPDFIYSTHFKPTPEHTKKEWKRATKIANFLTRFLD